MFPNKHLTPLQVITSLKEKDIKYDYALRCKKTNLRGVFVGVKLIEDNNDDEDEIAKLRKELDETKRLLYLANLKIKESDTKCIFKKVNTLTENNKTETSVTNKFSENDSSIKLSKPKKITKKVGKVKEISVDKIDDIALDAFCESLLI
jgi:hypothetical protein